MASSDKSSLSASGPKPPNAQPHSVKDYKGVAHPPHASRLESQANKPQVRVESLEIEVQDEMGGSVPGFLHLPPGFAPSAPSADTGLPHRTAAILLSGAGGGVVGPSSIYLSLASKLAALGTGIPALRLDYRYPARNAYCVRDVRAAMALLAARYGADRFVLVGWSFGGAPVFTIAGGDERVIACATVASQTAETDGVRRLAPRPLLLLHGTGDGMLSHACSERLYAAYGSKGDRTLHLFEGDDHSLRKNARAAEEMLCNFIVRCVGLRLDEGEKEAVVGQELVEDGERAELMRKGGDLRSPERVE